MYYSVVRDIKRKTRISMMMHLLASDWMSLWTHENMNMMVGRFNATSILECVYSLSIFLFPFIFIFCRYLWGICIMLAVKRKTCSCTTLAPSHLFFSSFALSWIKHYHTNDVLAKAVLYFLFLPLVVHLILIQRVSRYSWWLVLHMHKVVHSYLNYKLLVKYELQIWYNIQKGKK